MSAKRRLSVGSLLLLVVLASLCLNSCGKTEEDKVKGMDLPLNAKRALLKVSKELYPKAQKRIDELIGKHVPLLVDWKSMAHYDEAYTTVERYRTYGFDPIVKAIEEVAKDEAGKSALAAKLERIELSGKPDEESGKPENLSFKDGVLKMIQGFDGDGCWDERWVKEALEEGL